MPKLSKKKQDELLREQHEARIRAALHWTEAAEGPDVLPPERVRGIATGYLFNAYTNRVDVACTGSVSHAFGSTDETTTQGARRLFSTRLRALLALRNAVEWECAERHSDLYSVGELREPQPSDKRYELRIEAEKVAKEKSYPDRILGVWQGSELVAIAYDGLLYWP